ncbi:MAG: serine/threonine-protein kinase [Planctomycetaceae bacterium]
MISGDAHPASWSGTFPGRTAHGVTSTVDIGRLLEGTMLGPYRLDRFIGGGGMGAVFRALDTTLDRVVAVKVLAGRRADDEELLKRFRNEAQSAARLDHENIGRVHAVGSEDGWQFIVFEYIEGTNLRDLVRSQGPFDVARAVDITIQVADALEHASQRDVVHRDIKPSNIVITPTGRARIVDMGLARLPQVAEDRELTVSGMTLGTFDYISPEQARDPREADVRSDLYSLGCTVFFMLMGRPPFAEGTLVQKLLQHQQAVPPALDELRADVPRRLADIVARLMEKDPLDRYQRPAVLVADLASFAEEQGFTIEDAPPLQPPDQPRPHPVAGRLPWLVPIAGLVMLVTGLWAWSAWNRRSAVVPPSAAAAGGESTVVRVVGGEPGDGEAGTLADAVRRVADGGVVELAFDGVRREPPLSLAGRQLVIRAAAGRSPTVMFGGVAAAAGSEGPKAACDIGDGDVEIRGVVMGIDGSARAGGALFAIRSGRLFCEDVTLLIPGDAVASLQSTASPAAVVALSAGSVTEPTECVISLGRTRVAGNVVLLDTAEAVGGRATVRWKDGEFVSPRPLITGHGTATGKLEIDCDLSGVTAACATGVVAMRDTASRPEPVRLRLRAADCRFIVSDPTRPFIEQVGGADVDTYRGACLWIDARSRYEGGGEFRLIDAPSERINEAIRDVVPPLFHESVPGVPPDPADWGRLRG